MEWEREQLSCSGMMARGGDRGPFVLPGAVDRYARDRVCDIRHIRLEIELDFENRSLKGVAATRLAPLNDGLTEVMFDAVEMKISSVTLGGEEDLAFENTGQKLIVRFPRPLSEGDEVTVRVEYETTPRRGVYFIAPDEAYPDKPLQAWTQGQDEDARYWFPCYDYPNEKATTEILATVPERFFVLSNGIQVGVEHNAKAKKKTHHWKQETPHVTYLVTLVVGEFAEFREDADGVPVISYVPRDREEDGRRSLENTADIMKFFSKRFGPYPYPSYSQVAVADFIFGGMENTTATTLTDLTLHDARAHQDFSSDDLVAHELAHQWWGDWLTCRDWSHAWL
ncbi:MAG: M1 family metallopeptidase, partial [Planctomycetota bacterium]|nr:M1 family metallopeptidase [Planctomycetota bacterium]